MIVPDVTIVLVLYNSVAVVGDCLAEFDPGQPIVAVDNNSADTSIATVLENHPDALIIGNQINRGYGPAVNQALSRINTAYALIINPDAIVTQTDLTALKSVADKYPGTGIVAPLLESPQRGLELSLRGFGERSHVTVPEPPDGMICTGFATGAVWLLRLETWREIGGFDENIFIYNEDHDFCLRATAAGYGIIIASEILCRHLVSASVLMTDAVRWAKEWNLVWSHLYVTEKHFGRAAMTGEVIRLLRQRLAKVIFYAVIFNRARFRRDAAIVSAVWAYLRGKPARD